MKRVCTYNLSPKDQVYLIARRTLTFVGFSGGLVTFSDLGLESLKVAFRNRCIKAGFPDVPC